MFIFTIKQKNTFAQYIYIQFIISIFRLSNVMLIQTTFGKYIFFVNNTQKTSFIHNQKKKKKRRLCLYSGFFFMI